MPTKRTPRTPKRRERSVTVTPEIIALYVALVDLFCDRENREDEFDDEFMEAHDRLNSIFGFTDVTVEETFLRDVPPDWLEDSLIAEWFRVRSQRVQLDHAANIRWQN